MGGFFGTISNSSCATDLFYGTDYNSHLGTRRGGMATLHEASSNALSIIWKILISVLVLKVNWRNSRGIQV